MISPARRAAYDVTLATQTGRLDLAAALAGIRDRLADARDRALATDVAVGTQRWRAQLDYLLTQASGRTLVRLDEEVLAILRMSAYQLRYLTRVPASAVVHDAVELTRAVRKRSATGLVNAVLRRVGSTPAPLPEAPTAAEGTPDWRVQAIDHLSVTMSHPAWLVERWLDRLGWERTRAWAAFNNTTAPVTLWPAPGHGDNALSWPPHTPTAWVPGGAALEDGHTALPWLADGRAFAQDEASAAVAAVAACLAQAPMLDACAAPGGKTLALAAALPSPAPLFAGDLRPRRVETLRRMLQQLGSRPIPVLRLDATALPFAPRLGAVLLDAPCSGLGTLRRDPDLRWRRRADDLPQLVRLQHAMLAEAMRVVGPGGRVIYATCSSEPDENEDVVREVLRHSTWNLRDLRQVRLPGRLGEAVTADGWLRTHPHAHGLESFFTAVLERPATDAG